MTPEVTTTPPQEDAPECTERLGIRISAEADHRLRLQHALTRTPVNRLVDQLLRLHLPTADELAERLREARR